MRYATHPWGRGASDAPDAEAWTEPVPVLTRSTAASYLGCDSSQDPPLAGCTSEHDPYRPLQMILELDQRPVVTESDWPSITAACLNGDATKDIRYNVSGDSGGHLYAPEVIEPWTEDRTATTPGLGPGDHAVDLYFNVSTWNPYGVVLFRTELRGSPIR